MPDWYALAERLKQHGVQFVIEPHIRFKRQPGEQATMFLLDPTGNAHLRCAEVRWAVA